MREQDLSDERALYEEIHREHYSAVLKHARRLGPPRHQEEAVQEVFLELFQKCRSGAVTEIRDQRSWLRVVLHNKMLAAYKKEQLVSDAENKLARSVPQIETPRTREVETKLDLRSALLGLDAADVVLLMDRMDGLSYAKLAEQEGRTVHAVRSSIYRARKKLKDQLEGKDVA